MLRLPLLHGGEFPFPWSPPYCVLVCCGTEMGCKGVYKNRAPLTRQRRCWLACSSIVGPRHVGIPCLISANFWFAPMPGGAEGRCSPLRFCGGGDRPLHLSGPRSLLSHLLLVGLLEAPVPGRRSGLKVRTAMNMRHFMAAESGLTLVLLHRGLVPAA